MSYLLSVTSLLVVVYVINSGVEALTCPDCDVTQCATAEELNCPGTVVKDMCGCCQQCAKQQGEECGGPWRRDGSCDTGLYCSTAASVFSVLTGQATGVCQLSDKQEGDVCGGPEAVSGDCMEGLYCHREGHFSRNWADFGVCKVSGSCDNKDCSGRGLCIKTSGVCVCNNFYSGDNCQDIECKDTHPKCPQWASDSQCSSTGPWYMRHWCKDSCGVCDAVCVYDGVSYFPGHRVNTGDCRECVCTGGQVTCTTQAGCGSRK